MRIKHMMIVSALCLSMATSCSSHSTETTSETTKKEVAIQLYSVRDLVKDGSNLDRILKDLADMGYTSVEAANYNDGKFYGKTPQEFKQMVEKSGMTVLSSHTTHGLSDEELASGDFTEALKWWDQCIAARNGSAARPCQCLQSHTLPLHPCIGNEWLTEEYNFSDILSS